jgi:hypothetical protein
MKRLVPLSFKEKRKDTSARGGGGVGQEEEIVDNELLNSVFMKQIYEEEEKT